MEPVKHQFAFDRSYQLASLPFGVTPWTAWVEVGESLRVRFGPWRLSTPIANIASAQTTGDFAFVKAAGPARLSLADHGISFATSGRSALCVRFHEEVPGIDPTGLASRLLRHPGATLTVADPEALLADLRDRGAKIGGSGS
ncbi:hypothetical protein [Nocardioides sp.]|uniref:hypothetical protein n=1 Tax=Nocardioides sp. TaxID=35761 RepID=UPI003564CD34